MLRRRVVLVAGAVCFIALTASGVYRIGSLERRVAELEQSRLEIAARPSIAPLPVEYTFGPPVTAQVPGADRFPNGEPLPKGASPFRFNGSTYYVVPLASVRDQAVAEQASAKQ